MKKPPIQILLELLAYLPIRVQYRLARILAFVVTRINNQISLQTEKNIHLCFNGLNHSRQIDLKKSTVRHTCYALIELAAVWCWPVKKILAKIEQEEICKKFSHTDKGRLVIAPHLGSWELLNIWLAANGRVFSLYKPQRNARVDNFILQSRTRNGAQLVPTDAFGLRKLIKGLKRGATVMILPDQKPRSDAAQIDSQFFGHVASTSLLIQNICKRIDCNVFIAAMYRNEKSTTFSLCIESLDHHRLAGPEVDSAQYLNDQIENMVRTHLDQYQWSYERFTSAEYKTL